jgi:hypothetical protein
MSRIATIFILLLLLSPLPSATHTVAPAWVIEKTSMLNIQGSSNVTDFTCEVTEYARRDTLVYIKDDQHRKLRFLRSELSVDINRFDCHKPYITSDFRHTLKAKENPCLKIRLIALDDLIPNVAEQRVNGTTEIILAGVDKRIEVDFTCRNLGGNRLELVGYKDLHFSDFNLEPPRKLAGLIRINEDIRVNFRLVFSRI